MSEPKTITGILELYAAERAWNEDTQRHLLLSYLDKLNVEQLAGRFKEGSVRRDTFIVHLNDMIDEERSVSVDYDEVRSGIDPCGICGEVHKHKTQECPYSDYPLNPKDYESH